MNKSILVYGAAGYTGQLICDRLKELKLDFAVAGRDAEKIKLLGEKLGVASFVFDTSDVQGWNLALKNVSCMINAAGPFKFTAENAMHACLKNKVHYLDISAEIPTYQLAQSLDDAAKAAGIMIISGAGLFSAYDSLVVYTAKRIVEPQSLVVAFRHAGGFSRGSVVSSQAIADLGNLVRVNGQLVKSGDVKARTFDFGDGPQECMPTPLGGSILSYKSTGIPNIREYFQLKLPALGFDFSNVAALPDGPSKEERAEGRNKLSVEIIGKNGSRAVSIADLPSGYDLTPLGVSAVASRIVRGEFKVGFQSPGSAFGESILFDIPTVKVTDRD